MGKTKIKTIDDSVAPKKERVYPERSRGDELVEKLKAELGIEKTEKPTQPKAVVKTAVKTDVKTKPKKQEKVESSQQRSKKYLEKAKDLDRNKFYPLPEALELVKKLSYSKFDGTLEAHVNTIQANLRGFVSLPFSSGKKLKILIFGSSAGLEGVISGNDETIEEITKGKVDFDLIITTPQWMPKLAKVARILGPKGLMPNPKNGTIADDIKKAVESFQAGKTEYKTEPKAPIIHLALGKLGQPDEELTANVKTLLQTVGKTRIKKVTLSPTMGPGVKLDLASL